MKCPVCPLETIPPDAAQCPGCGTDVTPVRRVTELSVRYFNEALRSAGDCNLDAALVSACSAVALDGRFLPARTLLGKILWSKKQHGEALRQWEEASRIDPDNEEARLVCETAGKELLSIRRKRVLVPAAAVLCIAALSAVLLFSFHPRDAQVSAMQQQSVSSTAQHAGPIQPPAQPVENNQSNTLLAAVQEKLVELESEFSKYKTGHKHSNDDVAAMENRLSRLNLREEKRELQREKISALLAELGRMDGVVVKQEGDAGTLMFSNGLFPSGSDVLSASARASLEAIVRVVRSQETPLSILIEGHTDSDPLVNGKTNHLDNWSLGLNRANAVLEHFRQGLNPSKARLTIGSSGGWNPPFPNDSAANRRKNRTALLHFAVIGEQPS